MVRSMMPSRKNTTTVKRYANRKLYDTRNSVYVTLDDIGTMVRKGEDVRVIDNITKENITNATLAQIIFEEEKRKKRNLPLSTLRDIIRNGQVAIKELVNRTTGSVQHTIHSATETAEQLYGKIGDALSPDDDNIIKDVLHKTQILSRNIEGKIKHTVEGLTHVNGLQREIHELQQKIIYLEKKLRHYEKR